jgi:hypothetical protein
MDIEDKELETFVPERIGKLAAIAHGIYSQWDTAEQGIRSQIASRDLSVVRAGCPARRRNSAVGERHDGAPVS